MNLWVARGPAARVEAMIMSSVANGFISTKTGGPVNGQVQDSVVASYELTRTGVEIDKYHAMALFAGSGTEPPRFDARPPGHVYTGRDIVSLLFAATPVNYSRVPSSYSDVYAPYIPYDRSETLTVMEQGRLVRGVLDKRSIGAKAAGGLFHLISRSYGPKRALDQIYALQQVSLQFLLSQGFTVGPADLLPSPEALGQIHELVSAVLLEAQLLTDQLLRGELVPRIGETLHQFYEHKIRAALKLDEAQVLRWVLHAVRAATNGFLTMIRVGSKGSNPNLIHVSAAIGQTEINAERIQELFGFRRTLPYYPRFATDAAAYGFVPDCYMTGMKAPQFIFQDMNGRFDLINKALSTSRTGYFARKSVMNNQSSLTDNYRRVTKDTRVVQYLYGEDGLDSRELEKVAFWAVPLSDAALRAATWVDLAGAAGTPEARAAAQAAVDQACNRIRADRDAFRRSLLRTEDMNFGQVAFGSRGTGAAAVPTVELLMAVDVKRIVDGVFIAAAAGQPEPPPAPPLAAEGLRARAARVEDLCARLPYCLINEIQERRRTPVPAHLAVATQLLCAHVRVELSPRTLARLTDEQLAFVADAVRLRYCLSLVDYGTAVGVHAAQAISEPLTQYMLDSHHRSVAGGTNKSGLVRVEEIFGARPVEDEQSSAMQLPLRPEVLGPPEGALGVAQEIANSIEHVTLRRFTRQWDTLLEPYGAPVYPPYAGDQAWVAEYERAHPLVRPPGDLTNWCFRFALDKAALVLKAVDLELVVGRLRRAHPGAYVVHTPEAVPEVVVRVWLRAGLVRLRADEDHVAALREGLLDTAVRGIRGVLRAEAEKLVRHRAGPDGALAREDRYAVKTVGTNLYGALLHGAVDRARAISTSVGDTYKLYGIEAARAKIVSEVRAFMEDSTPNLRHLYLYADEMAKTGRITSVERGGLSAREYGNVLLRMAYGDPIRAATEATLTGATSRVYGVAAPQILGAVPQLGTLYNSFAVDESFVRENVETVDSILDAL
jgi:DNA-directed RNA polymerase beta' subunit